MARRGEEAQGATSAAGAVYSGHRRAGRQSYGSSRTASMTIAAIAASRLRYPLGFGGRMPCAARNSAGDISATLVAATRARGKICKPPA